MDNKHRQKIQKNYKHLMDNMDAKYLLDYCIEKGIITIDQQQEVLSFNPNTSKKRNEIFLCFLLKAGPRAYGVFLEALNDSGYDSIAETIEGTHASDDDVHAEGDWFSTVPKTKVQRKMTDKELGQVSQLFGKNWQLIMTNLGLSKAKIEQSEITYPVAPASQIFDALHKWRNEYASAATLGCLIKAMKDTPSATVDWEKLKEFIQNMK